MRVKIYLCLIFIGVGCIEKVHDFEKLRIELVRSAILTNASFPCNDCISGNDLQCKEALNEGLKKIKEVKDDSLKLTMTLQHFHNGLAGAIPHVIIYINVKDSLAYAFSFNDESNFLDHPHLVKDNEIRSLLESRNQLENQLNTISSSLHINNIGNEEEVKKLINLFFRSLLGCHPVTVGLGDTLNASMKKTLRFVDKPSYDSCTANYEANFLKMKLEIEADNALYFTTHIGIHSFWRVKVDTVNSQLIIRTSLLNYQCFTSLGL